tara:strand:- start:647 stop:1159 length:513 start_codon:yes stop_codon:yes gene_type:complete
MAKNTFFIRALVTPGNSGTFVQSEIDLGSYTNLGSSKPEVLRIHNIRAAMTNSGGEVPEMTSNTATTSSWQLTTQSKAGLVLMTDDAFVAGGRGAFRNPDLSDNAPTQVMEEQVLPQDFTEGYLVAVPSLFLGATAGTDFTEGVNYAIILECSTEALAKASAVSLAVSQQ